MSRQVDLSQPLSEDDRQYLVDRCRWEDIKIADANHPTPEPRDPNSTPGGTDAPAVLHPADVGTQTAELPSKPLPDVSVPAQAEAAPEEDRDNYDDAEVWSYAELQQEAKSREGVTASGSREEIVARLREDDDNN